MKEQRNEQGQLPCKNAWWKVSKAKQRKKRQRISTFLIKWGPRSQSRPYNAKARRRVEANGWENIQMFRGQ